MLTKLMRQRKGLANTDMTEENGRWCWGNADIGCQRGEGGLDPHFWQTLAS